MADHGFNMSSYSTEADFMTAAGLTVLSSDANSFFFRSGSTSSIVQEITPTSHVYGTDYEYQRAATQRYGYVGMKSTRFGLPYPLGSVPPSFQLEQQQTVILADSGLTQFWSMSQKCFRVSGDNTATGGTTYTLTFADSSGSNLITSSAFPQNTHMNGEFRLIPGTTAIYGQYKATGDTAFTTVLSINCAPPSSFAKVIWDLNIDCIDPAEGFVLQQTQDIQVLWGDPNVTYYTPNLTGAAGTTATKFSTPGV